MRPAAKVGLVIGGYLLAGLLASGALSIYVAATSGPDRDTSGGMYAFGDSLLFLAIFAVAAAPPTGLALFMLRSVRSFWPVLSVVALAFAAVALAAAFDNLTGRMATSPGPMRPLSALLSLKLILSPFFALAFGLSGLFAPTRGARIAILTAAGIEAAAFATFALRLFLSRV